MLMPLLLLFVLSLPLLPRPPLPGAATAQSLGESPLPLLVALLLDFGGWGSLATKG